MTRSYTLQQERRYNLAGDRGWDDASSKRAKQLWAEGDSATQIAVKLAREGLKKTTRNAVIGFIHRQNLHRGAPTLSMKRAPKQPRVVRVREENAFQRIKRERADALQALGPKLKLSLAEERAAATARGASLAALTDENGAPLAPSVLQLGPCQCRWPVGDPAQAGFAFCARATAFDQMYCPAHTAMAYVPATMKRAHERRTTSDLRQAQRIAEGVW